MIPGSGGVTVRAVHDDELIHSDFSADTDMAVIIGMFVDELPQRIEALQAAASAGDADQVRVLAHQLKGSAGGYGYPRLGAAAALVDQGIKEGCDANVLRSRIGSLVALAARVRR